MKQLLEKLEDERVPFFLSDGHPVLDPTHDVSLGAPVVLLSVPKSGTHLLEAILAELGFHPIRAHGMTSYFNDQRWQIPDGAAYRWPGTTKLPVEDWAQMVLPGQVIMTHCSMRGAARSALKPFRKVYSYRDLREVMISHWRSHNQHNRMAGAARMSLIEYMNTLGIATVEQVKGVAMWRNEPDVFPVTFGELANDNPEQLAVRLCDYLGWEDHVVALHAIERGRARRTVTHSDGGRSTVNSVWTDECEAWFRCHLADVQFIPDCQIERSELESD